VPWIVLRSVLKLKQLPLGFFAAFFGMNNQEINGSPWMHLDEQMKYMCRSFHSVDIIITRTNISSSWPFRRCDGNCHFHGL
jgi:hypothetical protein